MHSTSCALHNNVLVKQEKIERERGNNYFYIMMSINTSPITKGSLHHSYSLSTKCFKGPSSECVDQLIFCCRFVIPSPSPYDVTI